MRKLFEIQLRVHPAAEHPQFENFNFGLLLMWLYSTDEQAAFNEAIEVFKHLPYKLIAGKSFDVERQNLADLQPLEVDGAAKAAAMGFYLDLVTYPPDAIEEQVLRNWPVILPDLRC